jgi:hypothetical protein
VLVDLGGDLPQFVPLLIERYIGIAAEVVPGVEDQAGGAFAEALPGHASHLVVGRCAVACALAVVLAVIDPVVELGDLPHGPSRVDLATGFGGPHSGFRGRSATDGVGIGADDVEGVDVSTYFAELVEDDPGWMVGIGLGDPALVGFEAGQVGLGQFVVEVPGEECGMVVEALYSIEDVGLLVGFCLDEAGSVPGAGVEVFDRVDDLDAVSWARSIWSSLGEP